MSSDWLITSILWRITRRHPVLSELTHLSRKFIGTMCCNILCVMICTKLESDLINACISSAMLVCIHCRLMWELSEARCSCHLGLLYAIGKFVQKRIPLHEGTPYIARLCRLDDGLLTLILIRGWVKWIHWACWNYVNICHFPRKILLIKSMIYYNDNNCGSQFISQILFQDSLKNYFSFNFTTTD